MKNTLHQLTEAYLLLSANNETAQSNNMMTIKKVMFKNKILLPAFTAFSAAVVSPFSIAAAPVDFTYQDWQVVCDNTRTCRLAGYQAEDSSDFPVSVLLVRHAGANAGERQLF